MENKKSFVHELGKLLEKYVYRLNIKEFEYLKMENGEEYVIISFNDGFQKSSVSQGTANLLLCRMLQRGSPEKTSPLPREIFGRGLRNESKNKRKHKNTDMENTLFSL